MTLGGCMWCNEDACNHGAYMVEPEDWNEVKPFVSLDEAVEALNEPDDPDYYPFVSTYRGGIRDRRPDQT